MNRILTFVISILSFVAAIFAQEVVPTMHVNLANGTTVDYPLADIADITFEDVAKQAGPVSFAVPNDFTASYVLDVKAGTEKVAEVAKEYVNGLGQVIVVYPCDAEGKADLTKGITSKGATVAWDASTKLPTVGAEGDDVTTFYVVEGKLLTAYDGETTAATVTPQLLVDRRGTETQTYRIVKIGLQYWMADNFRGTKYTDGSAIASISGTDKDAWNANTTGCYYAETDADWAAIAGRLYNGYVAVSDKIAPEGWRVPSCADYTSIRTSVGARTAKLYKDSAPASWGEGNVGTNDTGFSVVATGYYSTATDLNSQFSDTYIWTSDSSYDALSKSNAIDFFRVTATGANAVFPTKGLNPHTYTFGHCLRFVRE